MNHDESPNFKCSDVFEWVLMGKSSVYKWWIFRCHLSSGWPELFPSHHGSIFGVMAQASLAGRRGERGLEDVSFQSELLVSGMPCGDAKMPKHTRNTTKTCS